MKQKAFTLTEILLVCIIIAAVAGISYPVFAKAKLSSLQSKSLTNLHQLAVGIELYRADIKQVEYGAAEEMGLPFSGAPLLESIRPPKLYSPSIYPSYTTNYLPSEFDKRPITWEQYVLTKHDEAIVLYDSNFAEPDRITGQFPAWDKKQAYKVLGVNLAGSAKAFFNRGHVTPQFFHPEIEKEQNK
jgi:type II secretory pathway pseudopilin PulG